MHFNRKKLRVVFTEDDYNSDKKIPLRQFRTKLAKALDIPATTLLIYQLNPQKKLGNMGSTLDDYGIKNGGELLAVQEESAKPQQPKPKTPSEQIDAVVNSVETELGDRIRAFVDHPPADPAAREQENRVLCEVVLAKTISLDNVEVTTPEERQKRKQAIATLQGYHKTIDDAMNSSSNMQSDSTTGKASENSAQTTNSSEQSGTTKGKKKSKKRGKK